MAKKKQKEDLGPPGAPAWMTTYSDMVTLLLTFFVLLIS
ncbi:MAG TPA: flagellar motor protein MotB, partial [Candidatus Marinimicrobia bacterium]|nr:flagellar motor protein MotB [Candidatus Neomarinimicrobiota bacterium]